MADIYKVSGLLQYEVTVKPYDTETVEFIDVRPNYFRVQNFGDTRILCGTSKVPTENNFDFACKADGMFMYSEPTNRGFLYIYNPSGNPARVKIVAFAHEFDPLTLAFSGIELDFSGTKLETSTAITGFNSPLPAGGNKIGSVDVVNQKDYTETIADVKTLLENLAFSTGYIDNVNAWESVNQYETHTINDDVDGKCYIHLLSNDGETPITVAFTNKSNGASSSFQLKAGESIQDLKFTGKLALSGSNYSYRVIVSYG